MTIQEKKEFLMQYQQAWQEADIIGSEIEILRSRAEKITSVISDTPKGSGGTEAGFTAAVDKIVELQKKLNKQVLCAIKIRQEIAQVIDALDSPLHRNVLYRRYIVGADLNAIADFYNYSYKHVCRIHGEALEKIKVADKCG